VGVEKLLPAKFAKTKLRQDALQTTFSVFLDIFYPPIFRCFDENGVFQQPCLLSTVDRKRYPSEKLSALCGPGTSEIDSAQLRL
jgi:hypothetical protein